MNVRGLVRIGLIGSLIFSARLFAHHSFATIDRTKELSAQGTVKIWNWTNPHASLVVEVVNGSDTRDWRFETFPPGALARNAITRVSFKPGDRVTVKYFLDRSKPYVGALNAVILDGKEITMQHVVENGTSTLYPQKP
jgi:hypothetical protein